MAAEILLNPTFSTIGDGTVIISAFAPRNTGAKPFLLPSIIVTFGAGISFTSVPNVFLTIASPHYVVSPITISTGGLVIAVNKVGEPTGNQNANVYVLIHGKGTIPSGKEDLTSLLQCTSVNGTDEELKEMAARLWSPKEGT